MNVVNNSRGGARAGAASSEWHGSRMLGIAACLACLLFTALWSAASVHAEGTSAERRLALVIGNGAYRHTSPLANPANDARAMAKALRGVGFEVMDGVDLTREAMRALVRDFVRKLDGHDVGLVYYAGHGMQVSGVNYLLPIDANIVDERDLGFEAIRLDFVLGQMEFQRRDRTTLVFLDACRDNPMARSMRSAAGTRSTAVGRGLAKVETGAGAFISFSTAPGYTAADGDGRNSPFTAALIRAIPTPGVPLNSLMIRVRRSVMKQSRGRQVPWDNSALLRDFYFVPPGAGRKEVGTPRSVDDADGNSSGGGAGSKRVDADAKTTRDDGCSATVGSRIAEPVNVRPRDRICAASGRGFAEVVRIANRAIAFRTSTGRAFTCSAGDLCQFDWLGGPLFRISAVADRARNVAPRGRLLPPTSGPQFTIRNRTD